MNQDSDRGLWPKITPRNINERIYELLLSKITRQEFAPGQKLPSVEEVASMLGVSRTPVKEAVNRLAVEGLLKIVPRKGTFVTEITSQSIKELFDVRLMMELYAAKLLISQLTDQSISELGEMLSSLDQFIEEDHYTDFESFLQFDSQFHLSMVRMAGNSLLLKLYEGINLHIQQVRVYQSAPHAATDAQATHNEHLAIISALKNRDLDALEDALTSHITNREKQFIAALEAIKNH